MSTERIKELEAEIERLREALEFYGTGDYSCDADWFPADGVIEDCGAKARNILADGAA